MFFYSDVPAFVLRLAIFLLLFSGYPLVHFFCQSILLKLLFNDVKQARITELAVGYFIILVGMLFALFYPKIGTVLSYVGAICGFVIIYLMPVLVYLAQSREEIGLILRGQINNGSNSAGVTTPQADTSFASAKQPAFRMHLHRMQNDTVDNNTSNDSF